MRELRIWLLVLAIIAIFAWTAYAIVQTVRDTTRRAIEPIQFGNELIRTQVSQFMNPTPTIIPNPVTIIREVRTLARLETIQYSVEKVITAETAQGFFRPLFGDRLLFVAHGIVIAGVDLEKITPDMMEVRDGILTLRLPPAEIFVATLDNQKSYVYDRDRGIFTRGDIHLETAARRAAEEEIRTSAIEDGIIDLAQRNAEYYLERLLVDLGYEGVIFIWESGEKE